MPIRILVSIVACLFALFLPTLVVAQTTQPADTDLASFYDRARQSLVAVQYRWRGELAEQTIVGGGVVVRDDGLIAIPLALVSPLIPDAQMTEFKVIIPSDTGDETEIPAVLDGRDEREDMAYVQAKSARKWTAIHFEDEPVTVGETIYSVGLLPKMAGYKAYLTQSVVSASLRGEIPQVLVSGGLSGVGALVFDPSYRAIGMVFPQDGQDLLLDPRADFGGVITPAHFFVATRFFAPSLADPPTPEHPVHLPWLGVTGMSGIKPEAATYFGLKNQPAVQIGDVIPDQPAAKAGLQSGDIIIKFNGQNLERGDLPEELPMILTRRIRQLPVGAKVTLTVLNIGGGPTREVTLTLADRPKEANVARRFYAKDLGFVAREAVFSDAYTHKMAPDAKGVVIDLIRRDGAAATAKLNRDDWVLQLNGELVIDFDQFKHDYEAFRHDHAKDAVVLVVHRRDGSEETINIEPPQSDDSGGGAQP
jgi:S1-C subfamily serine protease